jgi:hypothetical protein
LADPANRLATTKKCRSHVHRRSSNLLVCVTHLIKELCMNRWRVVAIASVLGCRVPRINPRRRKIFFSTICLATGIYLSAVSTACGGSNSPTTPSAPPAPTYTNLIGGWSGTSSISAQQVATGIRATNICASTWIVTVQNGASMSGTFQLSGGTVVACAQSGNFSGSLSTTGAIQLNYSTSGGGGGSGCTYLSGDTGFTGVATASSITAQQSQRLNCSGLVTDQIVTLSLTRR